MKICKICGVTVKINPLLAVMAALWLISGYWSTALVIFLLLLLHELGHILAAAGFSVRIYELELLPFGSCAKMDSIFEGHPVKESVIAASGPAVSLIFAVTACTLRCYFPNLMPNELELAEQYGYLIAGFNLIPVLPLDGGRILRALLSRRCDFGRATRIVAAMGIAAGTGLVIWGIYTVAVGKPDILLPMLGIFLVFSAWDQYRQGRFELAKCLLNRQKTQYRCESLYVKELAIRQDMKISGVLRLLKDDDKYYVFKVLDGNMQVTGTFDERLLQQEMLRRSSDCTVKEMLGA
ncbi:MAG: site-2 protease family protein [Firmicutes bacterium]|nr:site-2 protease family protein [Bacillota bacterium]